MYSGCSSPLKRLQASRVTRGRFLLFLHNLRILDHVEAITRDELAFDGDCLGSQGNQVRVDRLVLADKQISLAVIALKADWQTHLDAFLRAVNVLGVSPAVRVVVDVADHIDDFAADGDFRFARLLFVFPSWANAGNVEKTVAAASEIRIFSFFIVSKLVALFLSA